MSLSYIPGSLWASPTARNLVASALDAAFKNVFMWDVRVPADKRSNTMSTTTHEFKITDTKDDRANAKKVMETMVASVKTVLAELDKFGEGAEVAGYMSNRGYNGDGSVSGNPIAKMLKDYGCAYDRNSSKYVEPKVSISAYTTTLEHDGIKAEVSTPTPVRDFINSLAWGSYSYLKA